MKKLLGFLFFYILLAVLLLPFLVTFLCGGFGENQQQEARLSYGREDIVFFDSELEEYVAGVVAAEMPASFPMEALKAQAVAARTYQVRQMQGNGSTKVLYDAGQAYISRDEQKEKWKENYSFYAAKIHQAVQETAGEIMVYEGEPILAAFHAQSAGRTEDAVHVWQTEVPYLKSVSSEKDGMAPDNKTEVLISSEMMEEKLGKGEVKILHRTDAGYVGEVQVGEKRFSGREVREALGLRSACFAIEKQGEDYIFTVTGYGHGVGMSQYGASFLAEEGKNYRQILRHYYRGIDFRKVV